MTIKQLVKLADMLSEQETEGYDNDVEDIYEALELAEELEKTAELYKTAAEETYDAVAEAIQENPELIAENPSKFKRFMKKYWPLLVAGGAAGTAFAVPKSRKAILNLLSKLKSKIGPKAKPQA